MEGRLKRTVLRGHRPATGIGIVNEREHRQRNVRRLGTVFYVIGLAGLITCLILLFIL